MRRIYKVELYFALVFAISWTGVLVTSTRYAWFAAMLAGPALACLLLTAVIDKRRGLRGLAHRLLRWRVGAIWYVTPLLAPLILLVVLTALGLASADFVPAIVTGAAGLDTVVLAVVVGILAGFFEELGWTGYATPRLLRRYSYFTTGLLIGLPWALWHMLPDFLSNPTVQGWLWYVHAAQWFLALCAFRIFMTWVFRHTSSLPLAMLLHATFTGSQLLLPPVATTPGVDLVWYGLFALELWLLVAFVRVVGDTFVSVAASREERARPLLGDSLVPDPLFSVTHAITIERSPDQVWPWVQQMGAGWEPIDAAGVVTAVEPGRDLVVTVPGDSGTILSWEQYLEGDDRGRTRLIVRGRASRSYKLGRLPNGVMVPLARIGQRWMDARHMRGIKRRAESVR